MKLNKLEGAVILGRGVKWPQEMTVFVLQGPACSGNCGMYKAKHINKLFTQEAEFNNCLINKIQGKTGKAGGGQS